RARFEAPEARMLVLRVCPARAAQAAALEPILGTLLVSPSDWMMRLRSPELLLGVTAVSGGDVLRAEGALRERLFLWGMVADVESRLVPLGELEGATHDLAKLFDGGAPLSLARGGIVVRDPAMVALRRTAERIAPAPVTVLILGETGVG